MKVYEIMLWNGLYYGEKEQCTYIIVAENKEEASNIALSKFKEYAQFECEEDIEVSYNKELLKSDNGFKLDIKDYKI